MEPLTVRVDDVSESPDGSDQVTVTFSASMTPEEAKAYSVGDSLQATLEPAGLFAEGEEEAEEVEEEGEMPEMAERMEKRVKEQRKYA